MSLNIRAPNLLSSFQLIGTGKQWILPYNRDRTYLAIQDDDIRNLVIWVGNDPLQDLGTWMNVGGNDNEDRMIFPVGVAGPIHIAERLGHNANCHIISDIKEPNNSSDAPPPPILRRLYDELGELLTTEEGELLTHDFETEDDMELYEYLEANKYKADLIQPHDLTIAPERVLTLDIANMPKGQYHINVSSIFALDEKDDTITFDYTSPNQIDIPDIVEFSTDKGDGAVKPSTYDFPYFHPADGPFLVTLDVYQTQNGGGVLLGELVKSHIKVHRTGVI